MKWIGIEVVRLLDASYCSFSESGVSFKSAETSSWTRAELIPTLKNRQTNNFPLSEKKRRILSRK
jgi:hypothetical protein